MNTVQWIILDAMGVVYKAGDDVTDWLIPFVKTRNANIDEQLVRALYVKASAGQITPAELWKMLGFEQALPEIEQTYLDNYPVLNNGVTGFLQETGTSKYKVAMLSNDVGAWSAYLRRRFSIAHFFEHAIISGDVKCRKPDPKIFDIAISTLQTKPQHCVFIDDRWKNLKMASELGFRTIYFNAEQHDPVPVANMNDIDAVTGSFDGLLQVIENIAHRKK